MGVNYKTENNISNSEKKEILEKKISNLEKNFYFIEKKYLM